LVKKKSSKRSSLIIWDSKSEAPIGDWFTLLWNQYPKTKNNHLASIPNIVEEKSNVLKKAYLAWVYEFGHTKFNGKSIIDYMTIHPGFSYWWCSSMAQKFNSSDTSKINNGIKALAFELFFLEHKFKSITLYSNDLTLAQVLGKFCKSRNVIFDFKKLQLQKKYTFMTYIKSNLPFFVLVLIYLLRYEIRTFKLRFLKKPKLNTKFNDVIFFDIFTHLDNKSFKKARFYSNYWTILTKKMEVFGIKSSWVHLFYKHSLIPNIKIARRLIDRFNLSKKGVEYHYLLEKPFSLSMLKNIFLDYFKIRKKYKDLKNINEKVPKCSDIDLWLFHKDEWCNSLCGIPSIDLCIKLFCLNEFLRSVPKQRLGIYLAENQPWEMALIYAWKHNGHGCLIGTPHTTIRYWDLRYFNDSRLYASESLKKQFLPNLFAINGPASKKVLINESYPKNKLIEVEALRFLYLNKVTGAKKKLFNKQKLRILVCGDFDFKGTQKLIDWMKFVSNSLSNIKKIVFKPHPAFQGNYKFFEKIEITNKPFLKLASTFDIVVTTNISSISVDAFCSGIPVVQVLDADNFNLSPLRNYKILFAKSAIDLVNIIQDISQYRTNHNVTFFNLNDDLSNWMSIISNGAHIK
jgi:surface carbohydrate biosynthesis protein (TIGR04326 family)